MAAKSEVVIVDVPSGITDEVRKLTGCSNSTFTMATVSKVNDDDYTFSVWVRADEPCTAMISVLGKRTICNISTEWERFIYTINGASNGVVSVDPTTDDAIYLYQAMLEQGTQATDWVRAVEDPADGVVTSSVDIDDEGIVIRSTGRIDMNGDAYIRLKSGSNMLYMDGEALSVYVPRDEEISELPAISMGGMEDGKAYVMINADDLRIFGTEGTFGITSHPDAGPDEEGVVHHQGYIMADRITDMQSNPYLNTLNVQAGRTAFRTVSSSGYQNVPVVFPHAYKDVPVVVVGLITNRTSNMSRDSYSAVVVVDGSVRRDGFTLRMTNADTSGVHQIAASWIAFGFDN